MRSGCHCTPSSPGASTASITPSSLHAVARRSWPGSATAWWWMEFTCATSARTRAASEPRSAAYGVYGFVLALLVPMAVDPLFGKIVDQRPTAHHRQELRAPAHAEHPLALCPGVLDQRNLGEITGLIDVHQQPRCTGSRVGIEVGVDVTAAGGDEGGTVVHDCGEGKVVGVGSGRQDHRNGSNLRQRRHIAAVGRVALGRRTTAEDPDDWANPHAMTAS